MNVLSYPWHVKVFCESEFVAARPVDYADSRIAWYGHLWPNDGYFNPRDTVAVPAVSVITWCGKNLSGAWLWRCGGGICDNVEAIRQEVETGLYEYPQRVHHFEFELETDALAFAENFGPETFFQPEYNVGDPAYTKPCYFNLPRIKKVRRIVDWCSSRFGNGRFKYRLFPTLDTKGIVEGDLWVAFAEPRDLAIFQKRWGDK